MKIALVLDRFDPDLGGLESWTTSLAGWLVGHGHEVHVLAASRGAGPSAPGITFQRIPRARSRLARARNAERLLRDLRPDVIHDTGTGWHFDVLQPQFGSRIADWKQNLALEPWPRRCVRWLSPRLRLAYIERRRLEARQIASRRGVIVAVSRMVEDELRRLHGVSPERMRVVYNGVDTERFTPARRQTDRPAVRREIGLGDDDVLFLVVAHNLRLKGGSAALAALRRVARADRRAHLAVIGRGDARRWRSLAERLGVEGRVRFLGFVDEPARYYAAADALAHLTFYDPCSLVVLEAWASGLPVVTTRHNGASELMQAGVHGFLVDPAAPLDIAGAMQRLLDPGLRSAMGEPARKLALARSRQINFAEILSVYEWAIEKRGREARPG